MMCVKNRVQVAGFNVGVGRDMPFGFGAWWAGLVPGLTFFTPTESLTLLGLAAFGIATTFG